MAFITHSRFGGNNCGWLKVWRALWRVCRFRRWAHGPILGYALSWRRIWWAISRLPSFKVPVRRCNQPDCWGLNTVINKNASRHDSISFKVDHALLSRAILCIGLAVIKWFFPVFFADSGTRCSNMLQDSLSLTGGTRCWKWMFRGSLRAMRRWLMRNIGWIFCREWTSRYKEHIDSMASIAILFTPWIETIQGGSSHCWVERRFLRGVVLYGGTEPRSLGGEIYALPWSHLVWVFLYTVWLVLARAWMLRVSGGRKKFDKLNLSPYHFY